MLYRGARILIMDEPTAVLAPQEVEELFRTLRTMTAAGRSVVFISHKLDGGPGDRRPDHGHAARPGDRRRPRRPPGATKAELARLMVGREVLELYERTPFTPGRRSCCRPTIVEADNDRGLPALRGVSLDVRAGEIVGIAAVAGNGQAELAEVITGLRPCTGAVTVAGERRSATSRRATPSGSGVAHVPEDRTGVGSAPNLQLTDNLIMKRYREPPVSRGWLIDEHGRGRWRRALKEEYQIAAPSIDTQARLLSGGNLQRLILAREIETKPALMVAVQPTRGLDVGAIETVHRLLLERREEGAAILLISEDLDEILALADRVDVIYEGRIVGSFDAADGRRPRIGLLMTGGDGSERGAGGRPTGGPTRQPVQRVADDPAASRASDRRAGCRRSTTVAAVAVALLISGVIIALVGGDPIRSYLHILSAAFGSVGVLSDTLVKATPLILTGLACALAFRMRLWNIGAEGQFLLGAWGASAVVLAPLLPAGHAGVHPHPGDDAGGRARRGDLGPRSRAS